MKLFGLYSNPTGQLDAINGQANPDGGGREGKGQHEENLEGSFHWKTTHDGRTAEGALFNKGPLLF